ncbi:subtilisin family serine protease [Rathayibacter sp. AY1D4]|uniref:S8 family peptidase n=1 Tax=Rathayibacter sp. AY1D4 TaxID=2080545 RepID=UPI000CE8FD81|nr:S8 family peptidase [Rathayibacter sp. AY1D4]PPH70520.1 subtilisin family serine protease [Rathayibacter sp. AY1D4]
MVERPNLDHLTIVGHAYDRDFNRPGGGGSDIRDVEVRVHGGKLRGDLATAYAEADEKRSASELTLDELRALGVILTIEGAAVEFPLQLNRLEAYSRSRDHQPRWLLLSTTLPTASTPETAVIWVADAAREKFMDLFRAFAEEVNRFGNAKNRELVANMGQIRSSTLRDLWQSDGEPAARGSHWWELWLQPSDTAAVELRRYADTFGLVMSDNLMLLRDRTVAWVKGSWDQLLSMPFTSVPVTEVRKPEFVDTVADLSSPEQAEYVVDFADRVVSASLDAPAVCHLDTGVRQSHFALRGSLNQEDMHSVVEGSTDDLHGHGTSMAGLALFGSLEELLLGSTKIELVHRLESVKILPDRGNQNDPDSWGLLTARAVSTPEAVSRRQRVFCMPVTAPPEAPGQPSLWSASVDALSVGVDVGHSERGIALLGRPDPTASRLFVISAGNVQAASYSDDHLTVSDVSPVEDPAHAWNALTVGASTHLVDVPTDPDFEGWSPVASEGNISPHSRTSLLFDEKYWPVKPDICMEGGNLLSDGAGSFHEAHSVATLRSLDNQSDSAIGSAYATSAATAQAAGLAARVMARYPEYWPETVRGLIVHGAEWTPEMRRQLDEKTYRAHKEAMLRRFGWGVPTEANVLTSTNQTVTLVTQDEITPFSGTDFKSKTIRLHSLPWPEEQLYVLGDTPVELRVTLSYFIEPSASRRGWRDRYLYPSHMLRFDIKDGDFETEESFLRRVNHRPTRGDHQASSITDRWLIGTNQRNSGSLHQDVWEGTGTQLARSGSIAVTPVGGWWKYRKDAERQDLSVRYSLIVSLRTQEQTVDLYEPIRTQVELDIPVEVPGT